MRDRARSRVDPILRLVGQLALGALLLSAGWSHLSDGRAEFAAQVPRWLPLDVDFVIVASGIVELALGAAVIALPRYRVLVGWAIAAFFVAIFPGNIAQFVDRVDAFGLTTDTARGIRLLFQPVLVAWALWATGAWRDRHRLRDLVRRAR